jgi:regulator of replication initiation timing
MTQEELILENDELRARLSLAEKWMKREVQAAIRHIQKKEVQNSTRKHFENLFEEDGIDMIAQRIMDIF